MELIMSNLISFLNKARSSFQQVLFSPAEPEEHPEAIIPVTKVEPIARLPSGARNI